MKELFPILAAILLHQCVSGAAVCYSDNISKPIVEKAGDYVIAGIFNLGAVEEQINTETNETELTCVIHSEDVLTRTFYGFTRAIGFVYVLDNLTLTDNYTLGYKIYAGCNSIVVNRLISQAISLDESIVGAVLAGYKLHIAPLAGMITAYNIPAIAYIYSDDELMDESTYPTLLSLLETETEEAMSMIHYLEEQGYTYIDVWYHSFSQEMAEYIYNEYIQQVGCGRIAEYTSSKGDNLIEIFNATYNGSTVSPAKVQLVLFNNRPSGNDFLDYTINTLNWTDTVYIFGYSNGRDKYIESYLESVDGNSTATNTFVFFGSDFLNVYMETFIEALAEPELLNWITDRTLISEFNRTKTLSGKTSGEYSSWIGYTMSGGLMLAQSLNITLHNFTREHTSCASELRRAIFDEVTATTHTIVLENNTITLDFINRSYSNGYTIKAYSVEGNMSNLTLLGRSSAQAINLINGTIPTELEATPNQQNCSDTCHLGTYRKFYDVVDFPCCWVCIDCQTNFYGKSQNQNTCTECGTYETNNVNHTACISTGITYLTITSSVVILGLTFSMLNMVLILLLIVYCIKMSSRPVIKAADPVFLVIFLVGLLFGNLGLVFTLMKPSPTICKIEFLLLSTFFTLVTSSLGLRALKIYSIFSAANNFTTPRFGVVCTQKGQLAMNSVILFVNSIITLVVVLPLEGWHYKLDQEETHEVMYLMCTTTTTYTILPFIIPSCLFLETIYFAFIMRNFPHNFRETTSIFASTLIAVCSAAMFLTGYNLSPPEVKSILRAIMVYITVIAFLASIFGPKIVIMIRAKNEMDEKKFITQGLRNYTVSNSVADGLSRNGSVRNSGVNNTSNSVTEMNRSRNNSGVQNNNNNAEINTTNSSDCVEINGKFHVESPTNELLTEVMGRVVKISDAVENVNIEDLYKTSSDTNNSLPFELSSPDLFKSPKRGDRDAKYT